MVVKIRNKSEERKMQEQALVKVNKVIVKNISGFIYRGDDKVNGVQSLTIQAGEERQVSEKKALQLIESFPGNWQIIGADSSETAELLTKTVAESQAKMLLRNASDRQKVTSLDTPLTRFIRNLKDGKVTVINISSIENLLMVIKSTDFIGLNVYVHVTKLVDGEFGADQKKNIRYCYVETADKKEKSVMKIKESKGKVKPGTEVEVDVEENDGKEEENDDQDSDTYVPPVKSKDVDVDDLPGDFSDSDDDMDAEDKKVKPKKKPSEVEDEDEDDEQEDDEDDDLDDEDDKPKKKRKLR